MKVVFTCDHHSVHRHYNQTGDGYGYFSGGVQAGSGIGSLFKSLGRLVTPIAKYAGGQLLRTGGEIARDLLRGNSIKSSVVKRSKQAGGRVIDKILTPKAIKRKKTKSKNTSSKRRRKQQDIFD